MSDKKRRYAVPAATPWDGRPDSGLGPAEAIVKACHRDIYRCWHAPTGLEGEAEFFNAYTRDACPRCGSPSIKGREHDS